MTSRCWECRKHMNYKSLIAPELKGIAKRVPYNKAVIRCANLYQAVSLRFTAVPKGVRNRRIQVEGYQGLPCKADIFEPANTGEKLPCLLYFHGGAFSYKASAYHKKLACVYAMAANCRVVFPDYHLTPKYPFPAAYEDGLAVYKYTMENAEELAITTEKIGLAGDSAGACLAALLCNHYEQEGLWRPCLQMLIYPATDAAMRTDSMKRFSDTPLWNGKNNRRMWAYYCKGLKPEERHKAAPMHSCLPQIIPDTYIETAEYDCLHDEGVLYGEKLRKAGARVTINDTKGTIHGYDVNPRTSIAIGNIEKRIAFLKSGFSHLSL